VKDLRRFSSFNGVFGIINSLGFSRSICIRALAIFADAFHLAVLANTAPLAILGQKAKNAAGGATANVFSGTELGVRQFAHRPSFASIIKVPAIHKGPTPT
jgi:hypothetical protein